MNNQQKILIVEDSKTQALQLEYILQSAGYITDIAFNGKQAIEKISLQRPDMVISDILMPEMDGFELCKIVKETYPDIPLMLLTQLSSVDDVINGIESGADNFITKDFNSDFFILQIKDLFNNFALRNNNDSHKSELEVVLKGKKRIINSNNNQILNLLISNFENAVEQNKELHKTRVELQAANYELEKRNYKNLVESEEKYRLLAESLEIQVKQRVQELSLSEMKYKNLSESLEIEVQKRTKELNAEKEKLISLLTNAPAVIAIWSGEEHIFEFANDSYYKTVGNRQLIGKSVKEALPEIAGQGFYEILDEVYKTGKPCIENEMYSAIDKGKGYPEDIYWNFVYQPIFDENNNVTGIIDFAFDITEQVMARKQVENLNRELSKSENEYRELAESLEKKVHERTFELSKANKEIETQSSKLNDLFMNAPAGICILEGPEHTYKFINPVYSQFVGNRDILNKPIREAVPEIEGQGFFELLDEVYKTGKPFIGNEMPGQLANNPDGSLVQMYFNFVFQPIFDSQGNVYGISMFAFDVSKSVNARKEVEKLNKDLNNSNKELQSFAYIASHDLQEPLRTISSYSELLVRRYKGKLDETADEFIELIQDGSKRMKRLIEDVLNYSKISRKQSITELSNLNEVVDSVKNNLRLSLKESNAVLIYDVLPSLPVEDVHMVQLFQNIISNAIKYRRKDIQLEIIIKAENLSNGWTFSISDNGIGISGKHIDKIFQIFQRLHSRSEYEGTGIGLANCKKIVELYNGNIWVESEEGKGSTFFFTIPLNN